MSNDVQPLSELQTGNAPIVATPETLLDYAVKNGADPDQLSKLMDLKERHDKNLAKEAFLQALGKFQAQCPVIEKSKQGHNYKYATLGAITTQIQPLLTECGLTYRFEQDHTNGIEVSCVITHVLGHSERTTMSAEADKSGSKNAVQAVGSTVMYLQRYTLVGSLGITTADTDTDGVVNHAPISGGKLLELQELFEKMDSDPQKKLLAYLKCELHEVTENNFDKVKSMMEKKVGTV